MSRLSIRIGFWSSILSIVLGIGYGIGLVMLMGFFPTPPWTTLSEYVDALQPASLAALSLCQATMFLSAPLNTILFCSIHDYARAEQKILTRIGLCMMTASMALGSQMYFVQFTTVRQNIVRGTLAGLEQFAQQNHSSAITAIGMLGWTFFFGLAFLFVAPIFSGGRLERWIRAAFLICGIAAMLGGLAYLFESIPLQVAYVLGITIAGTVSVIFLAIFFRRMERDLASTSR